MIIKEHKTRSGNIIAICDSSIIGKKFVEGDAVLDLSSDFYRGKKSSKEEILSKCKKAYIINAVGEETINLLLSQKIISEKNIIKVQGIPFAQCILIENEK
ncbi:MAG: DUF424 family protein [Candidatus Woesearchaeota archaeon]